MQIFRIFDRYIGKAIFTITMTTLFILISLSSIIKFIDQLKKIGQGSYDTFSAGIYTLLSLPKDIQIFFPIATLLGVIIGLGILAHYNELIIMQVSGYTQIQIASSVVKTVIPLTLLILAINEWLSPQGEQIARDYRAQAMYGGSLISNQNGLWIKDGNNFIHIEHINNNSELEGINIYSFDENHHLQSIRYASTANFDLEHKLWRLSQVSESIIQDLKKITCLQTVSGIWKTNLTPYMLDVVAFNPDALSINGLLNYVKYLNASGQNADRYQFNMWNKIFQPVSVAAMILMAISFIFGPLRNVPISICVLTGVSFGFIFHVLDQIFGSLTLIYGIPPIIGALLPSTLFFFISFWLFLKYT